MEKEQGGLKEGWSLALASQFLFGFTGDATAEQQQLGLYSLPTEVVMHMLSFVADARDLCSLALVCRTLEVASRDDSLWRPLGHASWADHHARAQQTTTKTTMAKVVVLGAVNVGKTSLILHYLGSSVVEEFPVHHPAATRVKLDLWDTHGAEQLKAMASMYFRSTRGVVLIYDVADRSSFTGAASWMADLRGEYAKRLADDVRVVLVGNKTDLSSEGKRVVTEREGRKQAEEWGVSFCECSAKTGEGVDALFGLLVEQMMGGWEQVAGMATPAHVPDEVTLAAALRSSSGSSSQLCLLQ